MFEVQTTYILNSVSLLEFSTTNHWEQPPNRDQFLEKVYDFFDYLSKKETTKAQNLLLNEDFDDIQQRMHQHLDDFAKTYLEDEEYESLSDNLSLEVSNPYEIDETLLNPEFSGKSFVAEPHETMTLNLAMRGQITNVAARFKIIPRDGAFYLELDRFFDKNSA